MKLSDVLTQMKLEPTNDPIAESPELAGGRSIPTAGWYCTGQVARGHLTRCLRRIQVTTFAMCWRRWHAGRARDGFIALGYAGWESGQLERECATTPGCRCPSTPARVRPALRRALARGLAVDGHRRSSDFQPRLHGSCVKAAEASQHHSDENQKCSLTHIVAFFRFYVCL